MRLLSSEKLYLRVLRPLLFQLEPERSHRLTLAVLRLLALSHPKSPKALATTVFGVRFANPIGLAAGVDKDGLALRGWRALGFGFAEIGTVTPRPQPGNPRPRLWRLPDHAALINRLGFPSRGMRALDARLPRLVRRVPPMRLGLNFGPNKDTPTERVVEDYAALMATLGRYAEFVVVNLSSPNTPGLRAWQAPERMRAIVAAIRAVPIPAPACPPLLIKLAPDLAPELIRDLSAAAVDCQLDGIVATNTTLMRRELGVDTPYEGGLSGAPLKLPARQVIAQIYAATHGAIPIIGVGGIASAGDAYGHICAGASLVEFYTGLVYRGPSLVATIKRGLADLLARDGFRSISEAVGSASRS